MTGMNARIGAAGGQTSSPDCSSTVLRRAADSRHQPGLITLSLRDLAQLEDITAGDRVEAIYAEALALAVKPALVAAGR